LVNVISRKKQELSRAAGKLGNENFVTKAPPEVVEKERAKLKQHQGELAELEQQYERYFGS
jgi:valyl-tRNA synthetase